MLLSQRQVVLILMGATSAITLIAVLYYLVSGTAPEAVPSTAVVAVGFAGLFGLYWYGWEPARYVAATLLSILVAFSLPHTSEYIALFTPLVFALALTNTRWVAGLGLGIYAILLSRAVIAGIETVYLFPGTLISFFLVLIALVLGSLALESARTSAEHRAAEAQAERDKAEQHAAAIERQAAELNEQNARQQELIEIVSSLETPAVRVAEDVLLVPVVGNMDSHRADALTRRLLDAVHQQRTRMVILDIAGISVIDTAVAQSITRTVRAVRLLGCEIVVTGISAAIATTLTNIGAGLDLHTAASPQEAMSQLKMKH